MRLKIQILLALIHVIVFLLNVVPAVWVEALHAQAAFPALRALLGTPLAVLPFSVGQLLLAAFVALAILALGELVAHGIGWARTWHLGAAFGWTVVVAIHLYLLGFGWLYRRPPLHERLSLALSANPRAFEDAARSTATSARTTRCPPPADFEARAPGLAREALLSVLPELGVSSLPATRAKHVWPSGALMLFGSSGVFWPFTQEPHVDPGLDPLDLTFVLVHELAHFAGFGSENEANFVAWLACTRSPEPWMRYAGHVGALRYFAAQSHASLRARLSELAGTDVRADMARAAARWRERRSRKLAMVRRKVYDKLLRSQGVERGIESYGEMIRLLVAWRQR